MVTTLFFSSVFDISFEPPIFNNEKVKPNDLLPYLGVYISTNSPVILSISKKDNLLLAEPKGQQIFAMEAIAGNKFKHDKSGLTLAF